MLAEKLLEAAGNSTQSTYIEDVFSTYLYTGNGADRSITNNIDLSTKGGMVWIKSRSNATAPDLFDTARGAGHILQSNNTAADTYTTDTQKTLTSFNTDGFSLGTDSGNWGANFNNYTFASWTFRKQPKFFDVVTWTGNGGSQPISHSLGSLPGCVIYKATSTTSDWFVVTRKDATNMVGLKLNTTAAAGFTDTPANLGVTSTTFDPIYSWGNTNGVTYVAYIFAHDAGGFGLTGTDNVITCGSFTPSSGNATVNIGYEPQWILIKNTAAADNWQLIDTMRGWSMTDYAKLFPNSSSAEGVATNYYVFPSATGFNITNFADQTYIYIAIRRGPMKVPTDATKVFAPVTYTGNTNTKGNLINTGFVVDSVLRAYRAIGTNKNWWGRLTGQTPYMSTNLAAAEISNNGGYFMDVMNGVYPGDPNNAGNTGNTNDNQNYIAWNFQRAPSFFDEVCYTGTGTAQTLNHNLGAVPELMIAKSRSFSAAYTDWIVYTSKNGTNKQGFLDLDAAFQALGSPWNSTDPTASVFSVGGSNSTNSSGNTFVCYLFATCAGVSKVGSYTGNGSTQTINCGFAGGARFVLIKRTNSTGDWYVYDTARGMTTLVDPYLLLNSTAAESATLGSVTTVTTGFAVNASILAAINTNGASYIFLAIA